MSISLLLRWLLLMRGSTGKEQSLTLYGRCNDASDTPFRFHFPAPFMLAFRVTSAAFLR